MTQTAHATLIGLLRAFTVETERYVDVRGSQRGLHRTHLHALAHVMGAGGRDGGLTPGELAVALNLSSPATSALLDRLESAGHVVRRPSSTDRRKVTVEMTPQAMGVGREVFEPLARELTAVMEGYDDDQLALVTEFMTAILAATARARETG